MSPSSHPGDARLGFRGTRAGLERNGNGRSRRAGARAHQEQSGGAMAPMIRFGLKTMQRES
eukprot:4474859-Pyramimonas_sp.AAC.1